MKKKVLAIIISVMVALSLPMAMVAEAYYNLPLDAGNFNDYGGGGDWGGGGTTDVGGITDYDDTYSSSGNSGFMLDETSATILAVIIFALIIIGLVKLSKIDSSYTSYETPPQYMPFDFTNKIMEFIKQSDKNFDSEKFIAWSKNIFITLQTAWSERDWEKIRTIEKEELFERHNTQIQEYIRLGKINCIDKIDIIQTFLHKYVRDKNFEHLTVCMKVKMIDYIIDEKSGKILKGSKYLETYMTYLLTFTRRRGVKTNIIDSVTSNSCPHCGAYVDSSSAGRCKYCGSIIHSGEYNWVLSDIQAVVPGFKNDNRGIILLK